MTTSEKIPPGNSRIQSIDFIRGAVMIIMAIDHVRVYSGLPAGGPTAGIFFTRWITHYCAPAFVFFAGTSAFLYLQKSGDKNTLMRFLVIRGVLLVILELTVIRFFWMWNFGFAMTGVIWTLGWCMVLLAGFVPLRPTIVGVIGLILIFFQQVFHFVPRIFPASLQVPVARIWDLFYPTGLVPSSGSGLLSGPAGMESLLGVTIFYVLIPWVGVMMAGYGLGQWFLKESASRNKIFLWAGSGATLIFLLAASANAIFNTSLSPEMPFLFKLLGQQKYPPSQLYLLMTIGPLVALLPWAEKIRGKVVAAVVIIGRVPMFYYLLHILLIHVSAWLVNLALSGQMHQEWYTTAPFVFIPEEDRWSLPLLYVVWACDVFILYFACRWYARYKSDHPKVTWLKYL